MNAHSCECPAPENNGGNVCSKCNGNIWLGPGPRPTPTTERVRQNKARRAKMNHFTDEELAAHDAQVRADERERIAVAIEANLDQMLLTRGRGLAGGFARGLNKAARIARSGGAS